MTTPTPPFKVGDQIGKLTVSYYCGYTNVGPDKHVHAKKFHWFECACACGETVILHQASLRQRTDCDECRADRMIAKQKAHWRKPRTLPEGVPDFARMRLR